MPFINCIVDLRLNILNDSPRCTKTKFTKLMMKSVLTAMRSVYLRVGTSM